MRERYSHQKLKRKKKKKKITPFPSKTEGFLRLNGVYQYRNHESRYPSIRGEEFAGGMW